MISAGLRRCVLRTTAFPIRRCQIRPSSKQFVLWNQIEQQLLVSSSVSEINSTLHTIVSDNIKETDIFIALGSRLCDHVEKLVDTFSIAELLDAARTAPIGTLDTLARSLVKRYTLSSEELISLCGILASRCSEDYVYDFSCLQSYFDQIDSTLVLGGDEYVGFLESVITIAEKFGPLDVSNLAIHAVSRCVAVQYSSCSQLRILRLLSASPRSCRSNVQARLLQQVCADLTDSLQRMPAEAWAAVLLCLDSASEASRYDSTVALCCALLKDRLADLSFEQLCLVAHVSSLSGLKAPLATELGQRLAVVDGDSIVAGLRSLARLEALTDGIFEEVCHRLEQLELSNSGILGLLDVSAMAPEMKNASLPAVTCLWKQGERFVTCIRSSVAVISFVERTDIVVPSSLIASALYILLDANADTEVLVHLRSILGAIVVLERLDGAALSAVSTRIVALARRLAVPQSAIDADLIAAMVRALSALQIFTGAWLKDCARYAAASLSSLCATQHGCSVLASLAAQLVEFNFHVAEFENALFHGLLDPETRSLVLLPPCAAAAAAACGRGGGLQAWTVSLSNFITLVWACAHCNLRSEQLIRLVRECVTTGALRCVDSNVLARLVELSALGTLYGQASLLERRAELECRKRLRSVCCDAPSPHKQECLWSLQLTLDDMPFTVLPSGHAQCGIHLDAVIVPELVDIQLYGGRHSLVPNGATPVVVFVDDSALDAGFQPRRSSRNLTLSALGYTVMYVKWRSWQSRSSDSLFWLKCLKLCHQPV